MNLTPMQVEIMKRADKTLSFGCLICSERFDWVHLSVYISEDKAYKDLCSIMTYFDNYATSWCNKENIVEIIWHPMNWGRLCYIEKQSQFENVWLVNLFSQTEQLQTGVWHKRVSEIGKETQKARDKVFMYFHTRMDTFQQTVLERPVELQQLVLDFLLTLPKCN